MLPLEVQLSPIADEDPLQPSNTTAEIQPLPPIEEVLDKAAEAVSLPPPRVDTGMSIDLVAEKTERTQADTQETPALVPATDENSGKNKQHLPPDGKLVYKFYWGKSRWLAGQAIHQWSIENGIYSLSSTLTTTGLIGLLRPIKLVETSRGIIIDDRLRPLQFATQWNDAPPAVAMFLWDKGVFRWRRGSNSFDQDLSANSFDKISYLYQLYMAAEKEVFFSPEITMGRRLEHYDIQNLGVEEVEIEGQFHPCIHLKRITSSADMEGIEIWLSASSNHLPIKMTYSNKSGEYFEQLISLDSIPVK